jgi:hypothetical protein
MAMKQFPVIHIDGDDTDNGGGNNAEIPNDNLGVPDDFGQDNQEQQQEDNTEVKPNPAWNAILEPLPQEFHKQIMPKLQEWDTNFAKVQSDYAPYKPLLENNVPYESVQKAFQLAALINSNPRAVYDDLGQRFGFNSGQGQQQVDEDDDDQEPNPQDIGGEGFDITKHPQFVQLQNVVNQLQQGITQQQQSVQQAQLEAQAQSEIDTEFRTLEAKVGKLPEDIKTEIVRRAMLIGDARGDGNYWIEEGYQDYAKFVNRIRNTRANNTAPDTLSGNGGMPQQRKNTAQMSDEERVEHWALMAQKIAEGNQ